MMSNQHHFTQEDKRLKNIYTVMNNEILLQQNGDEKVSPLVGGLSMREVEESLVSVGALTVNSADAAVTPEKLSPGSNFIHPAQIIESGKRLLVSSLLES